ncbi:MAG: selenide, water dikinase SelD [Pseudomonadota bacterium]
MNSSADHGGRVDQGRESRAGGAEVGGAGSVRAAAPAFGGLRALAGCGGCAAKAPPDVVALLADVAASASRATGVPGVLVGLEPADDAAVYALDAERALVATVDFFPPIVDDPSDYGAIAAANALSDVYAMGGVPAFALAVSGFPDSVPAEVIESVARAAARVVADCGALVLGGHTIRCREPVFGLCAFGFVDPRRVWRKSGARPGDALVLSKPLGTGILVSSARPAAVGAAVAAMRETNRVAAERLRALAVGPSAVTDVTGFGLAGHAAEMAGLSGVQLRIEAARVPLLEGALAAAREGVRTSAHRRPARDAAAPVVVGAAVEPALHALLHDPQTSGGLLAAVPPGAVEALLDAGFVAIGEVAEGSARVEFH